MKLLILGILAALAVVSCQSIKPAREARPGQEEDARPPAPEVRFFEFAKLEAERAKSERSYLPFLRTSALHCGVTSLPKGGTDGQKPHGEDEVYYVVQGRSQFTAAGETKPIGPGSVLYVKAEVEHRFHDIEESLEILVFFSTAKEKR